MLARAASNPNGEQCHCGAAFCFDALSRRGGGGKGLWGEALRLDCVAGRNPGDSRRVLAKGKIGEPRRLGVLATRLICEPEIFERDYTVLPENAL